MAPVVAIGPGAADQRADDQRHELDGADEADERRRARERVDLERDRDQDGLRADARERLPDREQAKVARLAQHGEIHGDRGAPRPSVKQRAFRTSGMTDVSTSRSSWAIASPPSPCPTTEGTEHSVPADPAPPATVIAVTCNHCPYVIAWNPRLRAVAEEYGERGVRFLAINANDATRYPADSPERMREFVESQSWPIPYLHDESQDVARALGAVAHAARLRARRRPAAALPRRARLPTTRTRARTPPGCASALDAVLDGREPGITETPARGCSVKWREPPRPRRRDRLERCGQPYLPGGPAVRGVPLSALDSVPWRRR